LAEKSEQNGPTEVIEDHVNRKAKQHQPGIGTVKQVPLLKQPRENPIIA